MNGKTLIIAEAGVNHNGSVEIAKKLVDKAKDAGADIVKFQTAKLDSLVSKNANIAEYQKNNIGVEESQKEMLRKLLLPYEDFIDISNYCKKVGITFLSTPFDIESIRFLNDLQSIWKIPSGEITNYPYLVEIAETQKDIILSTGMSTLEEINDAINVLKMYTKAKITLLHCTTNYPTPLEDVNLRAMLTLKERFGYNVGYSDHTKGIEVPIAAVAMGATVIEKHFTLDRNMVGPDHKASLEPNELKEMISAIRKIEKALGNSTKMPTSAEMANRDVARKSIIASTEIKKGDLLSENNITTKRPGTGISPMRWNELIGTRANRDYHEDDLIQL